jgi:hypothetical protein
MKARTVWRGLALAAGILVLLALISLAVLQVWAILMLVSFLIFGLLSLVGFYWLLTMVFPGLERVEKAILGFFRRR